MTFVEPDVPPHPADNHPVPVMAASPVPEPRSEGTSIEMSRAVAEVQAMIVVAQQRPRNEARAVERMEQSCGRLRVAEKAFFRYSRGEGAAVTGSTINLMVELARCWGNITQGLTELRRDHLEGVSEMQAWAWDLETNTRFAQIFIVPHIRDTKKGGKALKDQRDVYEHLASQGNRRMREMMRKTLPDWFVEQGEDTCRRTLENGEGVPVPKRIADAVAAFDGIGVSVSQLEQRLERPQDRWTGWDVGVMSIVYRSIRAKETTIEDEFPAIRVTAEEITAQHNEQETAT